MAVTKPQQPITVLFANYPHGVFLLHGLEARPHTMTYEGVDWAEGIVYAREVEVLPVVSIYQAGVLVGEYEVFYISNHAKEFASGHNHASVIAEPGFFQRVQSDDKVRDWLTARLENIWEHVRLSYPVEGWEAVFHASED